MKKNNFDGMSAQVAVIKNSSVTTSLYCFDEWEDNTGMEFLSDSSFCKFLIYDFKSGKGDASRTAVFNISRKDVMELALVTLEHLKYSTAYEWSGQKIYANYPEREGRFKGKCKSRKASIAYSKTMPDGTPANNPWVVTIRNGYAEALPGKVKGSFYEKSGSFTETVRLSARYSAQDFASAFKKAEDWFEAINRLGMNGFIDGILSLAERKKKFQEYQSRNEYFDEYGEGSIREAEPAVSQTDEQTGTAAVKVNVQTEQQTASGTAKVGERKYLKANFQIKTIPASGPDGYWYAKGIVSGKDYTLAFPEMPEQILADIKARKPLELKVFPQGKIFIVVM